MIPLEAFVMLDHILVIPVPSGWNRSDAMEVFRQIDTDGNGVLSLVEFQDWWEVSNDPVAWVGMGSQTSIVVIKHLIILIPTHSDPHTVGSRGEVC